MSLWTPTGPPIITDHPTGGDVPMGRSITLMCRASGLGTLVYFWERSSSGSNWTTVSNDNTTSYTTNSNMAVGEYMYRCIVNNEAGSVMSNNATVNVYGEYFAVMLLLNFGVPRDTVIVCSKIFFTLAPLCMFYTLKIWCHYVSLGKLYK